MKSVRKLAVFNQLLPEFLKSERLDPKNLTKKPSTCLIGGTSTDVNQLFTQYRLVGRNYTFVRRPSSVDRHAPPRAFNFYYLLSIPQQKHLQENKNLF